MKSILQEIYEQGLAPSEQPTRFIEQGMRLQKTYIKLYEEFTGSLSEKQRKQFNILWDQLFEWLGYTGCDSFIEGFQLGARIMLDVLDLSPVNAKSCE